jgi:chromosome segregation ATPase
MSSTKAPSVQRSEEFDRIQQDMESCISKLAGGFELLRSLQSAIRSRFDYISQAERELDVARGKLLALDEELRRIADDRDAIRRDLQRANERVSELTSTIERLGSDADAERRRLGQQIAANAAGRIEEFKNRLGLTLSRLIVDLPEADSLVSSELGKILLLQFHQFLDALGQEGVETRPGVRSR